MQADDLYMEKTSESKIRVDASALRIIADRSEVRDRLESTLGRALYAKTGDLLIASDQELAELATYLLRLSLGQDCAVSECYSVPGETPDDQAIDDLLDLADGLLTHSVRILDPTMPSHQIVVTSPHRASGITSADAHHHRPYYWCGNAAKSLAKNFWTRDVRLNHVTDRGAGRWAALVDLVAEEHPAIMTVFREWPMTARQIERIVAKAKAATATKLPEAAGSKQVYLPIMDEEGAISDYILVTPIMSMAVNASLRQAVSDFYERHQGAEGEYRFRPSVEKNPLLFGGTKPMNVSDYASEMKGMHPCLSASIPKPNIDSSLVSQVRQGSSLIALSYRDNPVAGSIDRPLRHPNQADRYRRDVEAYFFEAIRPIRIYLNERMAAISMGQANIPDRWPLPNGKTALSKMSNSLIGQVKLSSDQVAQYSLAFISGVQKQAFKKTTMSDEHIKLMKPMVEKFLRDWRNDLGADLG